MYNQPNEYFDFSSNNEGGIFKNELDFFKNHIANSQLIIYDACACANDRVAGKICEGLHAFYRLEKGLSSDKIIAPILGIGISFSLFNRNRVEG